MRVNFRITLWLLLVSFFTQAQLAMAIEELPDESIYHIGSDWKNQNGEMLNIASLQDKVQVMAFVYTYCEHSCPVILGKLKYIERGILPAVRSNVNFTLISLDPKRDTPEVLQRYMKKNELNEKYWHMLNGDADDVLELAALIGVRYKPMNNASQDIAHSNMITVLDKQGRIYYQMKGLDASLEKMVNEINHVADRHE